MMGSCAMVNCALGGFNRVDGTVVPDAGVDDAGDDGGGGMDEAGCNAVRFPTGPMVTDAGGSISFTTAVHAIALSEHPQGGPIGVDLDRTCTCFGDPPEPPSCVEPDISMPACDEAGGRDNAVAPLAAQLSIALGVNNIGEFYSGEADEGVWSMLIRVEDYNGEADDDQVRLSIYTTPGYPVLAMGPPLWDGTDVWPVSEASVDTDMNGMLDINLPLYTDPKAFVTGGVLVGSLPTSRIVMAGSVSRLEFTITAGGLMAQLVDEAGGWTLRDGVMSGRWAVADIFQMLSSFRDSNGAPFCTSDVLYSIAKPALCNARDISSGLGGPTALCDAVSIALYFEAEPAQLGTLLPAAAPSMGCPAMTDPIIDNCL
jgi:hypothetical protein